MNRAGLLPMVSAKGIPPEDRPKKGSRKPIKDQSLSSDRNIPPDKANIPPDQTGPNLARSTNPARDFLEALNDLVGELKDPSKKDTDALKKLKAICLGNNFDFMMGFRGHKIKQYPNLSESIDQNTLTKHHTPISLIVEGLSNLPEATNATTELLRLVPNLREALGAPIYRNFSDSPAAYMTNNPSVIDWLLEQGATRESGSGEQFESGINIAKLDRKLFLLSNAEGEEAKELKSEIKDLFRKSIRNNEKLSMKIIDNAATLSDETQDPVAVLLNLDYLNDFPTDFILDLLKIAVDESFDFHAFGKDYGVQNLLYKICRNFTNPPNIKIVQFLLEQGLDPKTEITRLDPHDGFLVDLDDEGEIDDFSHTGKIGFSTKGLVQGHLKEEYLEGEPELLEKWQAIVDLF